MNSTPRVRAFSCALASLALVLAAAAPACAEPAPTDSAAAATPAAVDSLPAPAADSASAPAVVTTGTTLNPRPVIVSHRVRLVGRTGNVVRSGPGSSFAIVGVFPKDASFVVIAKSGPWYNIRLSDSETGWVHASLCKETEDLSGLEFRPNPRLYTRTGTYVANGYSGAYAFDRKSNSIVLGGRLGYYVFDRLEVEAGLSWTHVHRPAEIVESLFDLSLEAEDFNMLFYQMNAVWELLPGRQMVPYLTGGVGSSIMLGSSEPSVNFGAGTRLFLSKRTATRWEVRDFRITTGSSSARLNNNNIEFTLGTEYLF
ncbi:MAG TPA: outer membrane beta-barrel domain-containing protein [Candidatus Acidoferrales bacterium]|nr:outer membrane beta-barrel domain-containing protein [Candidatus Acidoferrales bacterium]